MEYEKNKMLTMITEMQIRKFMMSSAEGNRAIDRVRFRRK